MRVDGQEQKFIFQQTNLNETWGTGINKKKLTLLIAKVHVQALEWKQKEPNTVWTVFG